MARFADALSEGILNRLVRAQMIKGSATKDKGKLVYQIRIDNASPLVLNGLAMLGTASKEDEVPKVLSMISVSPRRSLTVPTERGRGQKPGPEEGDQGGGARPERAVIVERRDRVGASCHSARSNNVQVQLSGVGRTGNRRRICCQSRGSV